LAFYIASYFFSWIKTKAIMIKEITIALYPIDAHNDISIKIVLANALNISPKKITGYTLIKKSLDARAENIKVLLRCQVFVDEPLKTATKNVQYGDVSKAKSVVIVGAGPAGLFCALQLISHGIKPIIIERGKDVRARRRDLALLNREGILHEDSNYCHGLGGAGTYSDGKLYTRSSKRGNVADILHSFVQFGADANILYEAHPHIGTNKLPQIITAMAQQIIDCGGEIHFETKLLDIAIKNNAIENITTNKGIIDCKDLVLATGHSARDIYILLNNKNILIEAKPLAIGVRIEHPQSFVDSAQYHCIEREQYLPPASYSLVHNTDGRGVFSFCMCPGGIIATASTEQNALVVNGWSPSKRNNPYANSGMVVSIMEQDFAPYAKHGALAAMHYQMHIEQAAFNAGGGKFVAPAQRLTDFVEKKLSNTLPQSSYIPGLKSTTLHDVLPPIINDSLIKGFIHFSKKMRGFFHPEAVVVATESRTSSPVRIPRDKETFQHPQVKGLYPCAEGAGYAGGIISAGMDGVNVANAIKKFTK
jgi:uncharacterized protein